MTKLLEHFINGSRDLIAEYEWKDNERFSQQNKHSGRQEDIQEHMDEVYRAEEITRQIVKNETAIKALCAVLELSCKYKEIYSPIEIHAKTQGQIMDVNHAHHAAIKTRDYLLSKGIILHEPDIKSLRKNK